MTLVRLASTGVAPVIDALVDDVPNIACDVSTTGSSHERALVAIVHTAVVGAADARTLATGGAAEAVQLGEILEAFTTLFIFSWIVHGNANVALDLYPYC